MRTPCTISHALTASLTLHLLSLGCRIKLNFKELSKSSLCLCLITLTLPLFSLCLHKHSLSISTKIPFFHILPCSPIPASSTTDTKPPSMGKQHCSDNRGTSVEEVEDQRAGAHTYAGCHRNASETQLHSPAWPANAQGEKDLRNWLGMKVKQHYSHPQKQMAISR